MRIGYARVSTDDQSLDLQLDALKVESVNLSTWDEDASSRLVAGGI